MRSPASNGSARGNESERSTNSADCAIGSFPLRSAFEPEAFGCGVESSRSLDLPLEDEGGESKSANLALRGCAPSSFPPDSGRLGFRLPREPVLARGPPSGGTLLERARNPVAVRNPLDMVGVTLLFDMESIDMADPGLGLGLGLGGPSSSDIVPESDAVYGGGMKGIGPPLMTEVDKVVVKVLV